MDFARNERGFCVGFAWNLILFSFVREREGYKHHADCTVHTPRSYDDHSKTYKVVRPPTPTPGISGPTQPQPPTLPPIVEDFPPLPPKPPATKDYKSHVQFEHLKQMGKVYGPIENKGMPTHSAATKMPSSLPTKTTGYPSEQGRTFRAQPVTVKQEEPT